MFQPLQYNLFFFLNKLEAFKGFDLTCCAAAIMKMLRLILATGSPLLCLLSLQFAETLLLSVKYTRNAVNWLKLATLDVLMYAPCAPALNPTTITRRLEELPTPRPILEAQCSLCFGMEFSCCPHTATALIQHVISLLSFVLS